MLEYKEDWDQARRRTEAWYSREIIGRCAVTVTAPKTGAAGKKLSAPQSLEAQWLDIDAVLDRFENNAQCTYYGGEAVPVFLPNLGPNVMSAWLGCPLHYADGTTWTHPIIKDWESSKGLHFSRDNAHWRWIMRATKLAAQRARDKFIVGLTDIHGGGDALAALRGTQDLCMDLALNPDKVRECELFLRKMWFDVTEELYQLTIAEGQEGMAGFLGWGPGRTWPLQEDLLALISPKMFREFFYEAIVEQCRHMDHAIFHLDGPESLPSLELLLDIPELDGIQWQPGAAHAPMMQWVPLIRKIQTKGKCVLIYVRPNEVESLLAELSPRGLMIWTDCKTEGEARDLVRNVETWTRP